MNTSRAHSPIYTPEQFLQQVELALPLSTGEEQQRLLEHARAWATVHYEGQVLQPLTNEMEKLENRYGLLG